MERVETDWSFMAYPAASRRAASMLSTVEMISAVPTQISVDGEIVSPANLNGANQIVVAGHENAVKRISDLAHDAEGRAITLKVSAGAREVRPARPRAAAPPPR